jgi:hypothetical protein
VIFKKGRRDLFYKYGGEIMSNKKKSEIDITTDKDAKGFLDKLSPLIKEASNATNKSEKSIYDIAKILVDAESKLKDKRKKYFVRLKLETTTKLGSSSRNLNKAIKVSKDKRIQANAEKLPNSFSALYLLTSLTDDQFNNLLTDKDVNSKITRDNLDAKIKAIMGKKSKKSDITKLTKLLEKINGYALIKLNDGLDLKSACSDSDLKQALDMTDWCLYSLSNEIPENDSDVKK